jgi:ribonuclease P protein subunit RPR2
MSPGNKVKKKIRRGYGSKRSLVNTIARERIQILLDHARTKAKEDDNRLARRYVELARKISMRTKVRIPREDKRFICKNCLMPLIPGRNARVRLTSEKMSVTITCLTCQGIKRYPYSRERKLHKTVNPYMTRPSAVKEFQ